MIYVVESGDSVDKIASRIGVAADTIIYDNQLIYPYELVVGQALFIRENGENESVEMENQKRSVFVNGYAYPFISPWVLDQTLPYLSTLSVFSYGFLPGGYLIAPWAQDQWLIERARRNAVAPILTLTPFDAAGQFNNWLIHQMVNSYSARQQLTEQLLNIMEEKGFTGVDVDFEYILAEDRDAFSTFVEQLASTLKENGYTVSVALAPKTSATQQGLLYEGKDYARLGAAANWVLLMTYEWGYTYGPPMAVAPINQVRRVVEYALTEIPSNKITMGVPNYGYDWPLPYVRGITKATTLGNVQAVRIAIENGAQIQYDEIAQSPYYFYEKEGITHEVWYEDVRSIQAKLSLIEEYNLKGAGYWQIMQLFRGNWLQLAQMYNIEK